MTTAYSCPEKNMSQYPTRSLLLIALIALIAMATSACATRQAEPEPPMQTGPSAAEIEAQRRAEAEAARRANDAALSEARRLLALVREHTSLNGNQQGRLRQGETAINNGDGRLAVDTLNALLSELRAARMTYTVVQGDSLWRIAGRPGVYGNPYHWPLIYKHNADRIQDADLIHPDQRLDIVRHPLRGEVDAAVDHARNRGAWEIGRVEDSDRRYLGR
jgi:nucleoid-associated protein YgaU